MHVCVCLSVCACWLEAWHVHLPWVCERECVCVCACRVFGASCVLGRVRYREVYECPCKLSKCWVVSLSAASVC